MNIRTLHAESFADFREQFNSHISASFRPNTAILFLSVSFDLKDVLALFEERRIRVFGCTSCGEFLYDLHEQTITDGGLVCTLLEMPDNSFDIRNFSGDGLNSFELGRAAGEWACSVFPDPALLVAASGLETDGEQLVKGIQEAVGLKAVMFGGLAGDDALFRNTYILGENKVEPHGVVIMALDTRVYEVSGLATSGWVGIGADKVITHSEGNIVYTIDGEPALDVYTSYLNVQDSDLPEIGVEYPLLVKKDHTEDVLRAVINVDREKKSLIFAGSVPQGAIVSFSSSPGFEIIETTLGKVNEFYEGNKDTDLLILFSCMARHNALGPTISEEIDQAWQNWKKPLIGFFTYGEIGSNFQAACDFHNETFTMVSIRQK